MQTEQQLLIDEQAAAIPIDDRERVAWATGQQVFVSSLIGDMRAERDAVRQAILRVGASPVMFEEDLGAQDIPAEQAYLAGVRRSDIYVGLFGPRYGQRMADGYSATEAEFREAERRGLRLCLFVNGLDGGDMDGAQRDLIAGVQNRYTTSPWSTSDDLGRRVEQRLAALAAEALAPWVRVGRTIFRARRIRSAGSRSSSKPTSAAARSMENYRPCGSRWPMTFDSRRPGVPGGCR
ncbi:DUF4062 domain-containing protein [Lysobacter korlensis]|uniref:DUF4062 domain-containing protein n=1 Tax=Lysobacter korlensis TaxID=553636 RepID=A0ABV6RQT2_9GAMM